MGWDEDDVAGIIFGAMVGTALFAAIARLVGFPIWLGALVNAAVGVPLGYRNADKISEWGWLRWP